MAKIPNKSSLSSLWSFFTKDKEITLVINPASFHYRYYSFLIRVWRGGEHDILKRFSMCRYCQTTFWLSMLTFACVPILVLGWICNKTLGRFCETKFSERFEDCGLASFSDESQKKMQDHPVGASCVLGLITILVTAVVICCLAMLTAIILNLPKLVEVIPLIWSAGWGLFHIAYAIGWLMQSSVEVAILFWVWVSSPEVINVALQVLKWFSLFAATSILVLASFCKASQLGWFNGIKKRHLQFIANREAKRFKREEVRDRLAKEAYNELLESLYPWECCEEEYPKGIDRCRWCRKHHPLIVERNTPWLAKTRAFKGVCKWLKARKDKQWRLADSGQTFKQIGLFSLIVNMFWAIKHKVCPLLVVMTDEEQKMQQEEAIRRCKEMEQENSVA